MKDHPEFPAIHFEVKSAVVEEQACTSENDFVQSGQDLGAHSLRLDGDTVLTGLQGAGHLGQILSGVAVEGTAGDVEGLLSRGHSKVEEVQVPLNLADRQKFLSEWSLKNGKLKGAKYALLLLPLAACGGGKGKTKKKSIL